MDADGAEEAPAGGGRPRLSEVRSETNRRFEGTRRAARRRPPSGSRASRRSARFFSETRHVQTTTLPTSNGVRKHAPSVVRHSLARDSSSSSAHSLALAVSFARRVWKMARCLRLACLALVALRASRARSEAGCPPGVLRGARANGGRPGGRVRSERVRRPERRDVGLQPRGHRSGPPRLLARQPVEHVRVRDAGASRARAERSRRALPFRRTFRLGKTNDTQTTPR